MGKQSMSFYEYMVNCPHRLPEQRVLAYEMRELAKWHKEIKEIDSMIDMFRASQLLHSDMAYDAVTGSLWCEYCAVSGRDMI